MLTAGSITRTNTARWWWCNGAAVNSLSVAFPISAWANSLALLGLLGETNLRENCSLARFPSVARYTALCSHYTIYSFVDCSLSTPSHVSAETSYLLANHLLAIPLLAIRLLAQQTKREAECYSARYI